ncbi:MAG: hypothetical protein ACO1N0_19240 [Fluviicola sp.]
MNIQQIAYLSFSLVLFSCGNSTPKEKVVRKEKPAVIVAEKEQTEKPIVEKNEPADKELAKYYRSLLVPKKASFSGYRFEYGYTDYNEEEYGFQNPGYLRVLHKGELIFSGKFEGEGEVNVKSEGYHNLGGKKLVFTLNYGTPACDYKSVSNYYVFKTNQQIAFLKECYSFCGGDGYACHIFNPIFPKDSLGRPNTILFAEGVVYNEKDQPDKIDTTQIVFSKNAFKVKKPAQKEE